jgi:hypothetical protein
MSGECIESDQNRLANVGECIESGQFSKMTILASARIRQKWQIFGEYSNSTNSPASGHCLVVDHELGQFSKDSSDFYESNKPSCSFS